MKIKFLYLLLLLLLIISCREEFFMDDVKSEQLIVVDGFVTNDAPPYIIKLSLSSLTSEPKNIPFSNCEVIINDDKGTIEKLTEISQGVYSSSKTGVQGTVGNKYQLSIKTPKGKQYRSDPQEMKESIEIDTVSAELAYLQGVDFPYSLPGYQFYISTKATTTQENYFFWDMSETYEYDVDNELKFIETRFGEIIYSNPRYDTLKTCWKTNKVNYFFTGKTTNLEVPLITNKPLHFVSTETKKLTKRYSLLVNQFVIDKNAYNYWKNIESQISNDNFLSTTQPFNSVGNIKNVNNPEEKIWGYFTVASISNKRIFINRPIAPFYYPTCVVITDARSISEYKRTHRDPYFYVEVSVGEYGITAERCLDCRNYGGKPSKPSFWINK